MLERQSDRFSWVAPTAGPIGFPLVAATADTQSLCEELAAAESVLLLPGNVYGEPQHVRIGFGRVGIAEALGRLERFLSR